VRTEVLSLRALNRSALDAVEHRAAAVAAEGRRLLRFLAADAAAYRHDVGLEAL
jgi:hypothetical protein